MICLNVGGANEYPGKVVEHLGRKVAGTEFDGECPSYAVQPITTDAVAFCVRGDHPTGWADRDRFLSTRRRIVVRLPT